MRCNKCNAEIEAGEKFCAVCGKCVEWQTVALEEPLCPHCFKPIDSQDVFCGYCGKNVLENPVNIEPGISKPVAVVCEKCGSELVEGALFCGGCGNLIGSSKENEEFAGNSFPMTEEPFYKDDSAFQYGGGYVENEERRTVKKQGVDKGLIVLLAILVLVIILAAVVISAIFIDKPVPTMLAPDIAGSVILK